jgi:hypothetical protein
VVSNRKLLASGFWLLAKQKTGIEWDVSAKSFRSWDEPGGSPLPQRSQRNTEERQNWAKHKSDEETRRGKSKVRRFARRTCFDSKLLSLCSTCPLFYVSFAPRGLLQRKRAVDQRYGVIAERRARIRGRGDRVSPSRAGCVSRCAV